jgi:hypothetical protein
MSFRMDEKGKQTDTDGLQLVNRLSESRSPYVRELCWTMNKEFLS